MKIFEITKPVTEGGNVFAGKTGPIRREDIPPTLKAYFAELKQIFPRKASIFNTENFLPLGSVGKKALSGDIDLGVSASDILDQQMSPESIQQWNIDPAAVDAEQAALGKRARTASPEQLRMKAFLKLLTLYINSHAKHLYCDEKKVSAGNIFGLYPQIDPEGNEIGTGVQIDWMIGDLEWLKFSYYSSAYPEESNVKGLHRTQLMLSAFQVANISFNHVSGIKDKETGETLGQNPTEALRILNQRLGTDVTREDAENYYALFDKLHSELSVEDWNSLLDIYFKILDSTRADIPDNLQDEWLARRDRLGLTGKFLPDTSNLKAHLSESGSTGADRVKSRADFQQFLRSYKDVISQFPGFVSMNPSGSYNSNMAKQDFGDIDLIVHIKSDKDKATVKKELIAFFTKQPETVIVPFTSPKYAGKRTYNSGEIVTVRYHDDSLGYSAQVDNIIALEETEANFKQEFLDMEASKQGLILGLVKVATLETDPRLLFKQLGINAPYPPGENQEYEFNLSSNELQLRLVTYEPGTYKQADREVVWKSRNFGDVEKLLHQYDLDVPFEDLLSQTSRVVRNPRSNNRIKGVFNSMISVKSGEQGTPKGQAKIDAADAVNKTLAEELARIRKLSGLK